MHQKVNNQNCSSVLLTLSKWSSLSCQMLFAQNTDAVVSVANFLSWRNYKCC